MFQAPAADLRGLWMAFGDIRVEDRCEWLSEQITATGSLDAELEPEGGEEEPSAGREGIDALG
jgi:hypothetical protein